MDDARLERLLRKSSPQEHKTVNAYRLVGAADEFEGSMGEMLRTRPRPRPNTPRPRPTEYTDSGRPMPHHGDYRRYKHHGCRCKACTEAIDVYRRAEYRKRHSNAA